MAEGDPLFSIIIPTYNCAPLLAEALASVIGQTNENWEAIVVNNLSSDDTEHVVAGFCDERIRLINFANKGVIAASRNCGLAEAKGRYIAFLDADDLWSPEKLEVCLEELQRGTDLVGHGELHFDANGYRRDVYYGADEPLDYLSLLLRGNRFSTSALICKAEVIRSVKGFDVNPLIITAEDYDLWLRLLKLAIPSKIIPRILGSYRIHSQSASAASSRHLHAVRRVIEAHFGQWPTPTFAQRLRYAYRWMRLVLAGVKAQFVRGRLREGIAFALDAAFDPARLSTTQGQMGSAGG